MSRRSSYLTHFAITRPQEPIYSLPPDDVSESSSSIYPAGFIPSAPSERASTADVRHLEEEILSRPPSKIRHQPDYAIEEEAEHRPARDEGTPSFTFSSSITLPSTVQFPLSPVGDLSSTGAVCSSMGYPRKRKWSEFFFGNQPATILLFACFIISVILILCLIIYSIILVVQVRRSEY